MSAGDAAIASFLESAGWGGAERQLLAADASFRRYDRIFLGNKTAVLMDAPPDKEKPLAFLQVAGMLQALGLSAPRLHRADLDRGLLLLEDFGDRTFTKALAEGASEQELYALATDVLIALHRGWRPELAESAELGRYGEGEMVQEAELFLDWYLPAARGSAASVEERAAFKEAWLAVLPEAQGLEDTLVLRDYHVDNLMVLAGREGAAACGLLDFQDAVLGSPAYDLVSLLEDARRDVSPEVTQAMYERYLAAFPGLDPVALFAACAVQGAQRHTRVLGVFARLYRRDGKSGYLRHLPRLWRLLEDKLVHPDLEPLRNWFDRAVPPDVRRRELDGEAA